MLSIWTLASLVAAALIATVAADVPKECPKVDPTNRTIHLAHEWDCEKFYKCDHGKRVLFECPLYTVDKRLHFNPVLEVCDWPEDAGCIPGPIPTASGGGGPTVLTTLTKPTSSAQTSEGSTQQPTSNLPVSPTNATSSTEIPAETTSASETSRDTPSPSPELPGSLATSEGSTDLSIDSTTTAVTEAITNVPSKPTEGTPVSTDNVDQNSTPAPSGNFAPHETNCSKFYEIVDSNKNPKECPRGLQFSPVHQICMPPSVAGCVSTTTPIPTDTTVCGANSSCASGCGDINYGSLVPHECACNKYYLCSNGDLIRKECPEGLHFDKTLNICADPESAGCESISTTPIPEVSTTPEIPTECPPDNSGPLVQLPHPTNCSLYYQCDNGDWVLQQCSKDLVFNPSIQTCDWPDSAGCHIASTTAAIDATVTTSTESVPGTTPSDPQIPTECPPGNSNSTVLLPHPYNCSLFYMCDNGRKVLLSCPDHLEFNVKTQECDWAASAGCTVSTSATPSTTEITSTQTSPSSTTQNTTESSSSTTQDTTQLPSSTEQDTSVPPSSTTQNPTESPSSTTQDTTELPNSTTQKTTESPNSTTQETTEPLSSTAQDTTEPLSSTTQDTTEPLSSTTQDTTDLPNSTTQNTTESPISTTQDTTELPSSTTQETTEPPSSTAQDTTESPSSTTQDTTELPNSTTQNTTESPSSTTQDTTEPPSSTTQDITVLPSSTTQDTTEVPSSTAEELNTTPSVSTTSSPCSEGSKLPHKTNCSLYYECEDGEDSIKECTDGLYFNPVLNICDWREFAGCTASEISSTESTESISSATDSSTDRPLMTTDDYIGQNTTASTTTEPTEILACIGRCPERDPATYTVLLPNEDCTKFCKCSNGRAYVYDCPGNLHFNPKKFVCDYPRRARCSGAGGSGQSNPDVAQPSR